MDGFPTKPIRHELPRQQMDRVTADVPARPDTVQEPRPAGSSSLWDLNELMTRLDGDQEFLRDLLLVFRSDCGTNLRKAQKALAEKDLLELSRAAHTLKGMLKNLSMSPTAELVAQLEKSSQDGNWESSSALLEQLAASLRDLCAEVAAQLAEVKA